MSIPFVPHSTSLPISQINGTSSTTHVPKKYPFHAGTTSPPLTLLPIPETSSPLSKTAPPSSSIFTTTNSSRTQFISIPARKKTCTHARLITSSHPSTFESKKNLPVQSPHHAPTPPQTQRTFSCCNAFSTTTSSTVPPPSNSSSALSNATSSATSSFENSTSALVITEENLSSFTPTSSQTLSNSCRSLYGSYSLAATTTTTSPPSSSSTINSCSCSASPILTSCAPTSFLAREPSYDFVYEDFIYGQVMDIWAQYYVRHATKSTYEDAYKLVTQRIETQTLILPAGEAIDDYLISKKSFLFNYTADTQSVIPAFAEKKFTFQTFCSQVIDTAKEIAKSCEAEMMDIAKDTGKACEENSINTHALAIDLAACLTELALPLSLS